MMTNIFSGSETIKAQKNFTASENKVDKDWIRNILILKGLAASANHGLKRLENKKYRAIISSIDFLLKVDDIWQYVCVSDIQGGAGTSLNMNVNEAIAIICKKKFDISVDYLDDVNKSQSTNDVLPTALKISCLELLKKDIESLTNLEKAFIKKSKEFRKFDKLGRTHLQDALPMKLGQEFGAYAVFCRRGVERLKDVAKYLLIINLGGTAIGTGVAAGQSYQKDILKRLKKHYGFRFVHDNFIDQTQNLDAFSFLSSSIKDVCINLNKIINDLRLLSSGPTGGFAEINLPKVQKGSTIMAGKANPVMAEYVNQICFQVQGNDLAVGLAVQSGQLELNVFLPVIARNILESQKLFYKGLDLFATQCILGIKANEKKCKENLLASNASIMTKIENTKYDDLEKEIGEK